MRLVVGNAETAGNGILMPLSSPNWAIHVGRQKRVVPREAESDGKQPSRLQLDFQQEFVSLIGKTLHWTYLS